MFNGQSREMSITRQITGGTKRSQYFAEQNWMAICRMYDGNAWLLQPSVHDVECLINSQGPFEYGCARREPDKPDEYLPRERDCFRTRQSDIQPVPGLLVAGRGLIYRVYEDVEIQEFHLRSASLRRVSASSSAATSAKALSMSNPVRRPILRVGVR